MIAVHAPEGEHPIVREFFELFKTPWAFHSGNQRSEVLICSGAGIPRAEARLVILYGGEENEFDRESGVQSVSARPNAVLVGEYGRIPIYGKLLTFRGSKNDLLIDENTREPAVQEMNLKEQVVVRVGYDLFKEVRHLLIQGQPLENASMPTLDLHIALLRNLIASHSIRLIEIPPVPHGYDFIACLTHDVDHVGVRNHRCDHTLFGFLYRATLGSILSVFRGRMSIRQVAKNWMAALSLPLVHLGLAKDFWYTFEQYKDLEEGLGSTFYFIPVKGNPGKTREGRGPATRAAKYDVTELSEEVRRLSACGYEIGVHGIDAWRDLESGRAEMRRIAELTGKSEHGVRMHWLFYDENAPAMLESTGYSYDSTVGYNETVGYRAGTAQSFRPIGVSRLMELPMVIMDTALFFPCFLNLSDEEAEKVVASLIDNATKLGGALTINWHDRSVAPERLWGGFYARLLATLKRSVVWFATASQAVAWFKNRRNVRFEWANQEAGHMRVKAIVDLVGELPGLRLRVHNPPARSISNEMKSVLSSKWVDIPWNGETDLVLSEDGCLA